MDTAIPRFGLYGENFHDEELDFVHLESISTRGKLHNWIISPHRHDHLFHMLLVQYGVVDIQIDMLSTTESGPLLVMVPPNMVHGFKFSKDTSGVVLTISENFIQAHIKQDPILQSSNFFLRPLILNLALNQNKEHINDLKTLFENINREYSSIHIGRTVIIASYLHILSHIILRLSEDNLIPENAGTNTKDLMEKFRLLIEKNYKQHWNVKCYAEKLNLSEHRLNSITRTEVNKSALQVIHERLILEAQRRLIFTSMSVNEISYDLGFNDPAYFSRFFTSRQKMPPGKFRKNYLKHHYHPTV